MARTDEDKNQKQKTQDKKGTNNDGSGKKKGKESKSGKKKKETEYKPGMSYLYDPCPHRVWTPKPGERDKSEPRGVGSPWYEPVKKKEDVDKEEEEKRKKKDESAQKKRQQAYEERQKQKEENEKKKKEEENKRAEKEKQKEEKKKQKAKEKKKKEDEKRKKQKEQREKDQEQKKKDAEDSKGKEKEKEKPQASYMYDPCPHRVYTPGPGEKDMAEPRGVGSPWYVPVRKKEDIDKEEEEKREKEKEKMKEDRKKRQKEKKEEEQRQKEEAKKEEERLQKEEKRIQARIEKRRKEVERRKEEKEKEDMKHEEMGQGVRKSRTDFTPELVWMMDFMRNVDNTERARRGEALRWKKEKIEQEIEADLAKDAFMRDFKSFIYTFIEAEWLKTDKKLRKLERDERRRRRELLENMDPLAKDLMEEGKRYKTLYDAAMGKKTNGSGEGKPSEMEDLLVNRIMQQLDHLDKPSLKMFARL